jgi:hypothetical protein
MPFWSIEPGLVWFGLVSVSVIIPLFSVSSVAHIGPPPKVIVVEVLPLPGRTGS